MARRTLTSSTCLCLVGVASLLVVGCSSGLIPTPGPSAAEVEDLKRQLVESRKQATVGKVEVARLEREINRLQAELAQARQAPPSPERVPTEVTRVVPGLPSDPIVRAEPEIEEIDLEEEPLLGVDEPNPLVVASPAVGTVSAAPSADAQGLYDEAYTLFHQQDYSRAEERFRRYVDLYPSTELADNALFWVGESRYARGDFSAALEAFTDTVARFPQGNKVGDAMLKAGKCLEALDDPVQARATYEEVARRYPNSAASAQANERLEALRGG